MKESAVNIRSANRSVLWSWVLTGCLLLSLGAAAVGSLVALERIRPPSARAAELLYLPKGENLKVALLGYDQIVADLLWLKAVQHFGEKSQTQQGYRWAYHVVDVVTDLDPKFVFAYQAAGTVLGVWAELPKESVQILEKGVRHNPDVWQLPFLLGYEYFYDLCETARAAEYLRRASVLPGAPKFLPKLAARMSVEAGDAEAALEFLARFYQQVKDERTRAALARRMKEVVAERDIAFLEEGIRRYEARYRKKPAGLGDLVSGGVIARIPEEPLGGTYIFRPADGAVLSTGLEDRLRVHYKVGIQVGCERFQKGREEAGRPDTLLQEKAL